MRVRPAVPDDAERIAEVHVLSWQAGYRGLLPQPLLDGLEPAQRVPRWRTTLEQATWPRRGTLVAEDADHVLGFADLGPTRDEDQDPRVTGEIASFYVVPTAWSQGIGRELMTTAVGALHVAGFAYATLWVLETNVRAIRFYECLGWQPDGAGKDDVVGGAAVRDLRYRRELR